MMCLMILAVTAQKAELLKGKWKFKDVADKEKLDATILNQANTLFSKTEMEFAPDGKYSYNPLGNNPLSLYSGTWTLNKEQTKVSVTISQASNPEKKQTSEWEIKGLTQTELKLNMGNAVIIFGKPQTELISSVFQGTNGKYGFKSVSGKILIEPKYDLTYPQSDGMIAVNIGGQNVSKTSFFFDGGKWTYIDSTGKEITNFKYDGAFKFSGGYALVKIGKKEGLLDKSGNEIIPVSFDEIGTKDDLLSGKKSPFHDGLIRVRLNEKWGFMDKTGKEVVPLIYSNAYNFSEGLAAVEQNEKWGFVDKTGKVVIPLKYDMLGLDYMGFVKGRVEVELDGRVFYIDKTGKEVK